MSETACRPDGRRRDLLKVLLALPAFAIFRFETNTAPGGVVEVGGWILRRSDVA